MPRKGAKQIMVVSKQPIVVEPKGSSQTRRPRRRTVRNRSVGMLIPAAIDYARTLEDPWEYPPVPLGFGTMVRTSLDSVAVRGQLNVNADGSFGLYACPNFYNFVGYNIGGASSNVWTNVAAANASTAAGMYRSIRPVSFGLRVFPLYAETSKPGILVGTVVPETSITSLQSWTPTTIYGQLGAAIGFGVKGCRVTARPVDTVSYEFDSLYCTNYAGVNDTVWHVSSLQICGLGFDPGTTVHFEAILNFEALVKPTYAIGASSGAASSDSILSKVYGNVESFYSAVSPYLDNPVVLDALETGAGYLHPSLGRGVKSARSAFGRGRMMTMGGAMPKLLFTSSTSSAQATSGQQSSFADPGVDEEVKQGERQPSSSGSDRLPGIGRPGYDPHSGHFHHNPGDSQSHSGVNYGRPNQPPSSNANFGGTTSRPRIPDPTFPRDEL